MYRIGFAALLGILLMIVTSAELRKKYALRDFNKLSWMIFPAEAEAYQQLKGKSWIIENKLSVPILLIAPYLEENFSIGALIEFKGVDSSRAGIFYNLQDDLEKSGHPTLMTLELTRNGEAYFFTLKQGQRRELSKTTFGRSNDKPIKFNINLTKLENDLKLSVNEVERKIVDEVKLPVGTFGFIIAPNTSITLSDFYFAHYVKEFTPYEGVDIEKLFPKEKKGK